jgi:tRNA (adenine37-N6)-methyltransferase
MNFSLNLIGVIHTPFPENTGVPIQSSRSETSGTIEIYSDYQEGLEGIEGFSRIYLLYGFHRADPLHSLKVQPFLDDQPHGIFTTRYPVRPNPIGLSIVEVICREENLIHFKGADMLDGTPLFDIKPYIPEFDHFQVDKIGWYQNRKYK